MAAFTRDNFPDPSAASTRAFRDLYVNHNLTRLQAGVPRDVLQRSRSYGNQVADAILAWAAQDGYADTRDLPFAPPSGPGYWTPTDGSTDSPPLEPHWGTLRTFALASPDACAPPPPIEYSEELDSPFYLESMAVYEASRRLTRDQRLVAHFWADDPRQSGTPPGRSTAITGQLLEGRTLADAVEAYALVGAAVGDAFISCWHQKFYYNVMRPETYIQRHIDPAWRPLIWTPPFPEYPSGHSVQSGATNAALVALFGDVPFLDRTHTARGFAPRPFESLTAAFAESGASRLYGGVHYPMGIDEGLRQGRCVGQAVIDNVTTRK